MGRKKGTVCQRNLQSQNNRREIIEYLEERGGSVPPPRPPCGTLLAALLIISVHVAVVYSKGSRPTSIVGFTLPRVPSRDIGSADSFETLSTDIELAERHDELHQVPRRLQKQNSHASGTGAVFWMNGQQYQDYPYMCKCDQLKFTEWESGTLVIKEGSDDWWNPANTTEVTGSGVSCAGSFSTGLVFGNDAAYCDANNDSAKLYDVSCVAWQWLVAAVVVLTML